MNKTYPWDAATRDFMRPRHMPLPATVMFGLAMGFISAVIIL